MKSENFFKNRKTTAVFAIVALIGGFVFLKSSLTGNVVLSDKYLVSPISVVGLLLVACSIVLAVYSVRKR